MSAHLDGVDPHRARELAELHARLAEAQALIDAIRSGSMDALVISGAHGDRVYTLQGADHPYRVLVETMNEGAATLLTDGTILYCNARLAEMVRAPLHQTLGAKLQRFVAADEQEAFARLLRNGSLGSDKGAFTLLTADGASLPVQISLSALAATDVPSMCAVVTDLSELRLIEQQLTRSLYEKEILLREIHHRVKNNLQIIVSLLRLQESNVADPAITAAIRDTQHRVRAMALVHEQLYRSGDMARIDFGAYLRNLADNVISAAGLPQVSLRYSIDSPITIDLDTALPLGLIVTELLSNSLKHAFPIGGGGTISVELRSEGGRLALIVADDGVGIPADYLDAARRTLGLQLVKSLAHQIRGRLTIESRAGTQVRLEL